MTKLKELILKEIRNQLNEDERDLRDDPSAGYNIGVVTSIPHEGSDITWFKNIKSPSLINFVEGVKKEKYSEVEYIVKFVKKL